MGRNRFWRAPLFASMRVILEAKALTKRFGGLTALRDVSLDLREGEILGLVGESGSGKSTLARVLTRLIEADSGQILFEGTDIAGLRESQLRPFRRKIQFIFQDPDAALNPRQKIRTTLWRAYQAGGVSRAKAESGISRLLENLGVESGILDRYPAHLSGGQKQRIVIARALSTQPSVLIADEPTASLDASIQVQVLNLLRRLHRDHGLSMIFISHDLRAVTYLSGRIGVLRWGRLVEMGERTSILENPQHPYTKELLKNSRI